MNLFLGVRSPPTIGARDSGGWRVQCRRISMSHPCAILSPFCPHPLCVKETGPGAASEYKWDDANTRTEDKGVGRYLKATARLPVWGHCSVHTHKRPLVSLFSRHLLLNTPKKTTLWRLFGVYPKKKILGKSAYTCLCVHTCVCQQFWSLYTHMRWIKKMKKANDTLKYTKHAFFPNKRLPTRKILRHYWISIGKSFFLALGGAFKRMGIPPIDLLFHLAS